MSLSYPPPNYHHKRLTTNIFESILSVKNSPTGRHKVVSLLGLPIKFKRRTFCKMLEGRCKHSAICPLLKNEREQRLAEQKRHLEAERKAEERRTKDLQEQKAREKATEALASKRFNEESGYLRELFYANVLRDTTSNCPWLKDKAFTLTGGAANYSFIFTLFKVLDEINPQQILEMGLGQTTKLTSQYTLHHPKASLTVVEHDQQWIDVFTKKITLPESAHVHQKDIIKFECQGVPSDKYAPLDDIVEGKKFDLIIIDGPFGFDRKYPRTNILDLIPEHLACQFVIVLDDAEREGEKNTAELIFNQLKSNGISFKHTYKRGRKRQLLITSEEYKFLHWI